MELDCGLVKTSKFEFPILYKSNWNRCCSMVGKNIDKGEQQVSLGKHCDKVGIAAHEFGHVLGYQYFRKIF